MCSDWITNESRLGTATIVTASINNNAGSSGNDTLTITATTGFTCTGGMKFGTIDLGAAGYVSSTINYTSTQMDINWAASPTITLKLLSGSTGSSVASSTIEYSCNSALHSTGSVACGANKARSSAAQQF